MPQETNLNVAPYFDDFTPDSNYYKVLFKPGFPVQARELTTMQSYLQNQVEDLGNHLFKEGARVIPGGMSFKDQFRGIQIDPEFLGVPVSLYLDKLIGKTIKGASSGVKGKIVTYITDEESDKGNYTLYISYLESGTNDGVETFFDNEVLQTEEDISYATTFIAAGEGFSNSISTDSNVTGMAFQVSQGIYFLRGYFVDVHSQVLILDQYSNTNSWRVGLKVNEEIISSDLDPSLTDNAQGFNNFTAPGADRLKITATLAKKEINELNDENFVELTRVKNGALEKDVVITEYNHLADEFARRTWDESGHYYCKDFTTTVRECLNNGIGNRGLYTPGQITEQGNEPDDNLMVYKVSPGKAYVKGYEVDRRTPALFDVVKPRSVKTVNSQSINFGFGPSFETNNVTGSPVVGFNTSATISLRSERVGVDKRPATSASAAGKEIGIARLYDFALETGSYNSTTPTTNVWDMSLWDLQAYTDFTVNTNVNLSVPTRIEGKSSGASGYLRYAVTAGTGFTAYEVKGNFFPGERLSFNGIDDNDRYTTNIDNHEISDMQSLWGSTTTAAGVAVTFTADIKPKTVRSFGSGQVTGLSGSPRTSTITSPGASFIGIVTTGAIVKYNIPGDTLSTLNQVTAVSDTSITVVGVQTVAGVFAGGPPTSTKSVNNIELVATEIQKTNGGGNAADNESLYSILPKQNVQYVDLVNSNLVIRRQFDASITNNASPNINADPGEVFLPFDAERYTYIRGDGTTEAITADKFFLTNGSTTLTIRGLGTNDTNAKLVATLRKSNVTSKKKIKKVSVNTLIDKSNVSASGIGATTLNDGLTNSVDGLVFPYGTRVQDDRISLNHPDVVRVYGIFESLGTEDPQSPSCVLGSIDGPTSNTSDLIIGEEFTGTSSGARGIYLVKKSDISINFIYLNNNTFEPGEIITTNESKITAILTTVANNSDNVTTDYTFETGQTGAYYGYSSILRKPDAPVASRKLKVYFSRATYDSNDTGDITTVNSYSGFHYGNEITRVNGNRLADIIDARPRVGEYAVTAGTRSPFEFNGRSFDDSANSGAQHSSKYVLANDESMSFSFNYYLPRVDRLYIDKEGFLQVVYGTPADNPRLPEEISGAMNVANVYLPAYLFNTSDAKVKFIQHKRYQMSDISKLEQRIKNLEYYTSLTLVESETMNKFVPDANGLNRFKSGIFVDNFTTIEPQDTSVGVRNAIDKKKGVLRPSHYTTAINLQVATNAIPGIGQGTATDTKYATLAGTNVRRTGQVITLNYTDELYHFQPYATRIENVTPFLVMFWKGIIDLEPDTDVWIDVTKMQPNDVMMEGSFQGIAEALNAEISTGADGKRMGITPVVYNSWETVGVSMNLGLSNEQETIQNSSSNNFNAAVQGLLSDVNIGNQQILDPSDSIINNITATGGISLNQQRTGSQQVVQEQIDTSSLGNRVVNRDIINFMRSRDIQFTGNDFKPYERVYAFFDGVDVTKFCVPKLVQIEMTEGTFKPGDRVFGAMPSAIQNGTANSAGSARLIARVAKSNHKYGPFDNPTDIYTISPYNRNFTIPADYSSSSVILNIDTYALSSDDQPALEGYIAEGMILMTLGGARAKVTGLKLIPDKNATIIGTFHVPDSDSSANPIFETGRSTFRLTGSATNSKIKGTYNTSGEAQFYSQGDVDTTQESTLSLRNAKVTHTDFQETQTIGGTAQSNTIQQVSGFDVITNVTQDITQITNITNEITEVTEVTNVDARVTNVSNVTNVREVTEVTNVNNTTQVTQVIREPRENNDDDPIAQTFSVNDLTGVFVTKVDFYFAEKAENIPVTFQMRTTELGTPTTKVLPYSEVTLEPNQINLSDNATVPTTFRFKSPVYLEPTTEYAMVLKSKVTDYKVWISRLGEADVRTLASEAGKVLVSSQPVLGSLFKSQNASVWTPSQYEDLKFDLYRAKFSNNGSVNFYNPDLANKDEILPSKGLVTKPNKIRVSIGGSVNQQNITDIEAQNGNTIYQGASAAVNLEGVPHGSLVGFAGSCWAAGSYATTNGTSTAPVESALTITNAGVGYTPASGIGSYGYTFTDVDLTAVTGSGKNGTADITIKDGVAVAATVTGGGTGYAVGDVLTAELGNTGEEIGEGLKLTVPTAGIRAFNEVIIDEVQGDFDVSASASQLWYIDSVGVSTELCGGTEVNGRAIPQSPLVTIDDGLHIKINQKNHGMYNSINKVKIRDIQSNVAPNKLAATYARTSTAAISVVAGAGFTAFEGVGVGASNPGYIKIDDEIIKYTGVSGNTLTGISRGIDNSLQSLHDINDQVFKYEYAGISLRRINTTHDLADVNVSSEDAITLDSYHIKIKTNDTDTGINRSAANSANFLPLKFDKKRAGGGPLAKGAYNIPFSLMIPKFEIMTPTGCNVTARCRTISASSVNGGEPAYQDKGYQQVSLFEKNYFDSQRMVSSQVNEDSYLTDLPGNKSFTILTNLSSQDERLSPVINLDHVGATFVNNRINKPVSNYATDFRVNSFVNDPDRFIYVTKNIILENPATSLQVILDAYVPDVCDIRVFYALNQEVSVNETIFTPFPGYKNLNINGEIITPTDSDGDANQKVPKVDVYVPEASINLFKEYTYSTEDLHPFKSYRIKIIGTSTNGAVVPQFQRLRATALA